jgi:hypothetical protein
MAAPEKKAAADPAANGASLNRASGNSGSAERRSAQTNPASRGGHTKAPSRLAPIPPAGRAWLEDGEHEAGAPTKRDARQVSVRPATCSPVSPSLRPG